MIVHINEQQELVYLDITHWEKFSTELLRHLELEEETELSITFVDNQQIQELNREFRDKDRPTDVLSFTFQNMNGVPLKILGDVIISAEKALEQSEEFGHSLQREISFLLAHGILHLLGYDHQTEAEEKEMFALQKQLLSNFSF